MAASLPMGDQQYVEVGEEALDLLRVPEAARRMSLSARTVWRLIYSGELESVKIGRARRVAPDDVAAYIARLRRGDGT